VYSNSKDRYRQRLQQNVAESLVSGQRELMQLEQRRTDLMGRRGGANVGPLQDKERQIKARVSDLRRAIDKCESVRGRRSQTFLLVVQTFSFFS
jgi:hypothetical protein